ncbi:MAG: MFS transporter [Gammaproteobacteria bacterium]|nr:MFS transporter [Gammaproteobacteria bacterium]
MRLETRPAPPRASSSISTSSKCDSPSSPVYTLTTCIAAPLPQWKTRLPYHLRTPYTFGSARARSIDLPPDQSINLGKFQTAWCAHGFLRELVLIYPVYAIMMGQNGVSPLDLSLLFAAWSSSVILLEVPSGALADIMSRKRLMIISCLVKGCCFLIWFFLPSFWGYFIGFLVWGFGSTLGSGTRESLVHDTLRDAGQQDKFIKIYGRGAAAQDLGVATALAAGGLLAESGYGLSLWLSAIAPWCASLVVLFAIAEPTRSGNLRSPREPSYLQTMRSGIREVRGNRLLVMIIAMFSTIIVVYGVLDEFIGPYLFEKGTLSLTAIGLVAASLMIARMFGNAFAHRLPVRSLSGIALFLAAMSCFIFLSLPVAGFLTGLPLAAYFAGSAAAEMQLQTRLQQSIEGRSRATITSLASAGQETTGVFLYLAVGVSAEFMRWHGSLALIGTLSVTLCLWFTWAARRLEKHDV